MPVPQITALPDPPSRQDPTNFAVKGDAFLGALPDFATEANALVTQVNERVDAAFAAGLESAATNAATTVTKAAEVRASELAAANFANAAQQTTLGFATNRPKIRPSLNLDFVNQEVVDPRITVARNSPKSYFGKRKVLGDENLVARSEEFDNGYWGKENISVSPNTHVAPDGNTTADSFVEATATGVRVRISRVGNLTVGVTYTLSVYVKYSKYQYLLIKDSGNRGAALDVLNGVVGSLFGGALSSSITPAQNGFYRCSVTFVANGTVLYFQASETDTVDDTMNTVSGDVPFILWGAQLEQRSALTAYTRTTQYAVRTFFTQLETAAANVLAIEYDPLTERCLGIRPEGATTNLLVRSEELDNASWSKNAVSIIPNIGIAPNGTLTADALIVNAGQAATGAGSSVGAVTQSATVVANAPYIFSFYVKAAGASILGVRSANAGLFVSFDLTTGAVLGGAGQANFTPFISAVGGGWYRVWMLTTVTGTSMGFNIKRGDIGDGYSGFLIWGAMLEASPADAPSSYVPTAGTQATRVTEIPSVSALDFDYNQNEGALVVELETLIGIDGSGFQTFVQLGDNTNNVLSLRRTTNRVTQFTTTSEGTAQASILSTAYGANQLIRLAATFARNNVSVHQNGALLGSDTSYEQPNSIPALYIGNGPSGNSPANAFIRSIQYYSKAIAAVENQALTQV